MNDDPSVQTSSDPMDDAQFVERHIAVALRRYDSTKNPLWVWYAIDVCSGTHFETPPCPFPKWVLDYLHATASGLLDVAMRKDPFTGDSIILDDSNSQALKLLGFQKKGGKGAGRGRTNQFALFATDISRINLAMIYKNHGLEAAKRTALKLFNLDSDEEARAVKNRIREGQELWPWLKNGLNKLKAK